MTPLYTAVTRFDPIGGDAWTKFIAWSGLTHLREVVSLDGMLCPTIFQKLIDEDWQHNVQEDFKIHLFYDLEYVLGRVGGDKRINVLAVIQEPSPDDIGSFDDSRFMFRGFDLVERDISALVNCGGFDKAFSPTDLSDCGLLTDFAVASSVQKRLREEYPDEHHADCDLWAIWQMNMHSDT